MEFRHLVYVSRPIFASLGLEALRARLGLEGFRSRDFEYCKEMVYWNFLIQRFLFVVFAGKKQPKHVGKKPEIWKILKAELMTT